MHQQLGGRGTAGECRARLRNHGAGRRHDPALAEQGPGGMGPRLVGLHPPLAVGQRPRRMEKVPRRRPLDLVAAGATTRRAPRSAKRPRHLGDVAVEPGDQTDPPEHRVVERGEAVARGEHGVLERRGVEVGLAVPGGQLAPRVEGEGGVVQHARAVHALGHAAGDKEQAVPAGRLAQRAGPAARRAARRRAGRRLAASRGRSRTTTARAARAVDTLGRGGVDHAQGDREVRGVVAGGGQPLGHPDQEVPLHDPPNPPPRPTDRRSRPSLTRASRGTVRPQRAGTVSRL